MRWNDRLWSVLLQNLIRLGAREYRNDGKNENVHIFKIAVQRGVKGSAIVAPYCDPKSPCSDDLDLEAGLVFGRTGHGLTLVNVGKTGDRDIPKFELSNQTFEYHQGIWGLDCIVVKMSMSG